MLNVLIDTLIDSIKLVPFVFGAFLLIEMLEHKFEEYSEKLLSVSRRFGPLFGSLLGLFPECGFSIMATGLYTTRVITLGTLIAIYLSTSDEMLVVMISGGASLSDITTILLIKFITGLLAGIVIDFLLKEKNLNVHMEKKGHEEHKDALKEAIIHTIKTFVLLFVVSMVLNIIVETVPENILEGIIGKDVIVGPIISGLVGLIPNCSASIMITSIYLRGLIDLGTAMAGLLSASGLAIVVLFKENDNKKENVSILLLTYGISAVAGIVINLFI